jgi:hypothetical protein
VLILVLEGARIRTWLYHLERLSSLRRCLSWCVTHDPKGKKVLLLLFCRATHFKNFGLGWRWRLGERCRTTTTSVVRCCNGHCHCSAADDDDDVFKLVVFKIGNADFNLVAWAWVRDLDLPGDAVE